MAIQDRLVALVQAGYVVGVAAVDDDGDAISYRITGLGIDTTVPVDAADEFLSSIEATHDERVAEGEKTPAELDAEVEAVVDERRARHDALVAKITASNVPVGIKDVLTDLVDARFGLAD